MTYAAVPGTPDSAPPAQGWRTYPVSWEEALSLQLQKKSEPPAITSSPSFLAASATKTCSAAKTLADHTE